MRIIALTFAGLAAVGAGCLTLPAKTTQGELVVFPDTVENATQRAAAEDCGSHLTELRRSAKVRGYGRAITTILTGTTTAVAGFMASSYADDDPDKAQWSARIALVSGVITVLAQMIKDPSEPLDSHRKAGQSWQQAKLLANSGGDKNIIYTHLLNCKTDREPPDKLPGGGPEL